MVLSSGTRLGPYEILSPLGAGGMGEVYRARDRKLDRDVALKVLPDLFAADPDRIARFEREARTLGSLNHPNIAQIYGIEDANGIRTLVMELVEGPTLSERIATGSIGAGEALVIARQIADALEAAHEHGIIHRDLKPANVKVREDGTVKVLDFGLAKFAGPEADRAHAKAVLSQSPTVPGPPPITDIGMILGTAEYMSPEQARGRAVDKRTDIWAFGCVLYEMLTGRRPFGGETRSDAIATILEREPDWTALPASIPTIARLLHRCLEKDSKRRLHDIADARIEIDDALREPQAVSAPSELRASTRTRWGDRRLVVSLVLLVIAALAAVMVGRLSQRESATAAATAADVTGPLRLVVLPFENLSRQTSDEWLAGAFSDSLTLGLRDAEGILLVNRERLLELDQNRNLDPQQIARALRVRYYVSGSFQRVGDDLKVVARLVDADAGTIRLQESFTDRFANLLRIEDDLSVRFAAALQQSPATTKRVQTSSLQAYQAMAQANDFYLAGRFREAIQRLEHAIATDAGDAEAWALLAKSYAGLSSPASLDSSTRSDFLREALRASQRAIELGPSLYEAHVALAATYQQLEQVESWRVAAQKAIELNPRLAEAYVLSGDSYGASPAYGCARKRDSELAERSYRKALQLNPNFAAAHARLINSLFWSGRDEEALHQANDAVELLPENISLQRVRASALLWLGRTDELEQQLRKLATMVPPNVVDEWMLAVISLLRGHAEDAAVRFKPVIERGPPVVREIDTGRIYAQVGRLKDAGAHLQRAFILDASCEVFVKESRAFAGYRDDPILRAVLSKYLPKGSS